MNNSSFYEKLQALVDNHHTLEVFLSDPAAACASDFAQKMKEYAHLGTLVTEINRLFDIEAEYKNTAALLDDPECAQMAEEEIRRLQAAKIAQEMAIRTLLLPKDADDKRNVMIEIRAGTGGDEAALFVGDLARMYRRFAECKQWKVEVMYQSHTEQGGLRDVGLMITGQDVFSYMKFEAGVHRVQRVPATEASGRLHTSTATVAILPEAEEIDVHIEEKDLKIDVFRSSGPGGQSVNTTDSAVRITHIPTGIVVQQQDEKSQHKNKSKALKILRARIYDQQKEAMEQERSSSRQSQVGRGDRSERIRTYNFPQGRVTDHRIKLTLHKIDEIMEGNGLDEIISALNHEHTMQLLLEQSHTP